VFVYKYPSLDREEIKAMLGTHEELKKTRFYQEIEEEFEEREKQMLLGAIPALIEAGMPIKEISKRLKVNTKKVQWAIEEAKRL
jgi:predicted transposase YdaD